MRKRGSTGEKQKIVQRLCSEPNHGSLQSWIDSRACERPGARGGDGESQNPPARGSRRRRGAAFQHTLPCKPLKS